MHQDRRDFVKMATVGATGLVLTRTGNSWAGWPTSGTLAINPDISNTKVVYCHDTAMMKKTPSMSFSSENDAVDSARVFANMDAMAMKLADKTSADEAWKTILRSSKEWSSTVVAIKVNTVEPKNMPRAAVLQKVTSVLVGFGVSPSNIKIYDSGGNGGGFDNTSQYSTYCSESDSSKIRAVVVGGSMGSVVSVPIGGGGKANCFSDIANGKVDLLINMAVNKGHYYSNVATLCLKNHFGTFDPNHDNLIDYMININKSDAILGGMPPRQQLCFVDSLIANKTGPNGTPEVMPCYLVMGVFAGAVDYLTIKKIREGVMSCTHDEAGVDQLVTGFGYKTSDPEWIEVQPGSNTTTPAADAGAHGAGGAANGGPGGASGSGKGGAGQAGPNASAGGNRSTGTADAGGVVPIGPKGGALNGAAAGGGAPDTSETGRASGATGTSGGEGTAGSSGKAANSDTEGMGGSGGQATNGHGSNSAAGSKGGAESESAGADTPKNAGCGCRVPAQSGQSGPLGAVGLLGVVMAGQLRRLLVRRETLARRPESGAPSETSGTDEPETGTETDLDDRSHGS